MSNPTLNVTIIGAERMRNSPQGNPVWRITTDAPAAYLTEPDSAAGYIVTNLAEHLPAEATITMSAVDQITDIVVTSHE